MLAIYVCMLIDSEESENAFNEVYQSERRVLDAVVEKYSEKNIKAVMVCAFVRDSP